MELILGLPPLTQYDAGATPMFNCFQNAAQRQTLALPRPGVDLNGKNTRLTPNAQESSRMDFSDYDWPPKTNSTASSAFRQRSRCPIPLPDMGQWLLGIRNLGCWVLGIRCWVFGAFQLTS